MAEIRQARLAGYINPGLEEQDIQGDALKRKQASLTEALGKYQIANAKEQQRQLGINKKANDWFAANSDALFSNSSNPLDPNSMTFSDPEKISALYKRYREEVGGNYNTFNEYINMGKANEVRNNSRQLTMMLDEYDSDKDAREGINDILLGMDEGERNRLFSMLDDETYSRLADIYDTDPDSFLEKAVDLVTENPLIAGGTAAGLYGAYRMLRRGRVDKIDDVFKAASKKGKKKRKGKKRTSKNIKDEVLALPLQKRLKGFEPDPNTIYAGGQTVKLLPGQVAKGGRTAQDIAEEAAKKGRNRANVKFSNKDIQDAEFEDIIVKSKQTIPDNKANLLLKEGRDLVNRGQLSQIEYKAFDDAIKQLQSQGVKLTRANVGTALQTRPGGLKLLEKIANKEMTWKGFMGYGLAGAFLGGGILSKGAEMVGFGEKGQDVAQIIGGTGGSTLPVVMKQLGDMVKEKGAKGIYEKLLKKKGAAWVAKKAATGSLKFLMGGSGIGTAIGAGLLALDAIEIYNILSEPD